MPKTQAAKRTCAGLYTQYNQIHGVPEGALRVASNVNLDRSGEINRRRGFQGYGTNTATAIETIFEFDDPTVGSRLIAHETTTLSYDSDGNGAWYGYSGSYSAPGTYRKIHAAQGNKSIYLATGGGVFKTHAIDAAPYRAGIPPCLDVQASTNYGSSTWLGNHQVGYRVVFGRVDPNQQLLIGAPSMEEILVNTPVSATWTNSGTTVTVTQTAHGYSNGDLIFAENLSDANASPGTTGATISGVAANTYQYTSTGTAGGSGTGDFIRGVGTKLLISIHEGCQEGDFIEVYRTANSANSTTLPGDECKKVARKVINPIATAPSPGQYWAVSLTATGSTVTVTYTAHGLATGDVVSVVSPSHADYEAGVHVITYVNANTFTYTVAGTPPGTGDCGIRALTQTFLDNTEPDFVTDNLYTNASREGIEKARSRPPFAIDLCHWKEIMFYANTRKEAFVDLQLLGITGITDNTHYIRFTIGATNLDYTFSTAEDLRARKFKRYTALSTSAQNVRETMKSLVRTINHDDNGYLYAWYTSGVDESPGMITVEYRNPDATTFVVTCNNSAVSTNFSPEIPTTGTDLTSDTGSNVSGIYRSIPDQPDAVPESQFDPVGDPLKEILRIIPLRDSVLIVKEEGIYRLTGNSERTWTIKPVDLTLRPLFPESWVALGNAIWGVTRTGVVRVTENSSYLMSATVADDIGDILEAKADTSIFNDDVVGVAYESDSKYILSVDTDISYVFSALADTGPTTWERNFTSAINRQSDNRLYITDNKYGTKVLKERKDSAYTDFIDEEVSCTITSVSTWTNTDGDTLSLVTITTPTGTYPYWPITGDAFRQVPSSLPYAKCLSVIHISEETHELYLDTYMPGLTTGTGEVYRHIPVEIQWTPEAGGNAALLKAWLSCDLHLGLTAYGTTRHSLRFYSDLYDSYDYLSVETQDDTSREGLTVRVPVPRPSSRSRTLAVGYVNNMALEELQIQQMTLNFRVTSDMTSRWPA